MKTKIKEIHNKLSNSKIDSFDSVLTSSSFSSVLLDRFTSELKKINVIWDLEPTTINKLIENNKPNNSKSKKSQIVIPEISTKKHPGIGIDIQLISSLPDVKDAWEEQFYKDNFSKIEITHCLKKKNVLQSFAGIYAVKEAIYKIDGTEKDNIRLTFSKEGKPNCSRYSISISHDSDYAIGVAIRNQENDAKKEIDQLHEKIKKNNNLIEKIETRINLKFKKSKKNYVTISLLILLISYMLFKELFYYLHI